MSSKHKNILHISNGYWSSRLYKELVSKLAEFEINQYVFVPIRKQNQIGAFPIQKKNVQIIYELVVTSVWYRLAFFLKIKKSISKLTQNVDIESIHLIHAHTLFSDGAVAYKMFKQHEIPYLVAVRNTDVNYFLKIPFFKPLGKQILLNARKVIFLSEAYKQRISQLFFKDEASKIKFEEKAVIIPNGVSPFWHENLNKTQKQINNNKLNFLFVGEISPNKNIVTTIFALDKLIEQGYKLTFSIVGVGLRDSVKYLRQIQTLCQTRSWIKMFPVVEKEKLLLYYRKADAFLMPSLTESFGLVYAEALTQGLPVIYSKNEGFDKTFPSGYVGYAVPANDILGIANGLKILFSSYNQVQKNCIIAAAKFSWDDIASVYYKIYRKIFESI